MNRLEKIHAIRRSLRNNQVTVGSWMQIPHASLAEMFGKAGYDWVAIDLEHGAIDAHQLPDLFRALELGETLPLARLAQGQAKDCKQALDSGAGGVIVPMIESAAQLEAVRDACRWPPAGIRGVGFSRANLFGKEFSTYVGEAQAPLLIAMIEHIDALDGLEEILMVDGLDAILVGPYDLSASMGSTGNFNTPEFVDVMHRILRTCVEKSIACGIHVVQPNPEELKARVLEGYRFIAYSIDSVFFNCAIGNPTR